ncbi:MAG: UDP-3-O-(3-hydroxymyristoyl)glucosamine N-acyltransferase, partial [Caulobacteraceae bacterium]|nr:UDP-3-O-(3-hydroxymyristoyl)glucosamine N-acyltransferase [Caulobacteraceae bacterium]
MVDPRFFEPSPAVTPAALAALTGARLDGPGGGEVREAASLQSARADSVAFYAGRGFEQDVTATAAGACFTTAKGRAALPAGCAALISATPQAAWALAADALHRLRGFAPGDPFVHPSARC